MNERKRDRREPTEREIALTCMRYQYESDEFMTAREKAVSTIKTGTVYPRF